ncbi:hypothetical protein C7974DRAFT_395315 [Boeremia exigua]|uniref:uncharacterized protein n=1 Tax=Boeremia exigua TaxID=749465 RepID=UPI001E8ED7C1|nr:uncharacterized protein C7974DRAFT_395315 [Boeremia exigua]KAH6629832.1 hypothetical protein C7974DRAFT_395315 [Boeremia exigua]
MLALSAPSRLNRALTPPEHAMPELKKRKREQGPKKLFHLSIKSDGTIAFNLASKFDAFPRKLTSQIIRQIIERHGCSVPRAVFSIYHTESLQPYPAAPYGFQKASYSLVGMANLLALDHFCVEKLEGWDVREAEWVSLEPRVLVDNPHFTELHALRVDDIGWGFDRNGCLSLSVAREEEVYVRRSSVYVQRLVQSAES